MDLCLVDIDLCLVGLDLCLVDMDLCLVDIDLYLVGLDLCLVGLDLCLVVRGGHSEQQNSSEVAAGGSGLMGPAPWSHPTGSYLPLLRCSDWRLSPEVVVAQQGLKTIANIVLTGSVAGDEE
ncbi:hypothetical protein RRG08_025958 [Elysia crispata]|uniref:Uncharacterized protein n=1 Tax=Elysia crispata TaxID=231223 RepID=A0AAE0ZFY5_9GAST|nr:hypothetical protein RRG08_025958 [Elysia crispata]